MSRGNFWQGIAALILAVGVTGTLLIFAITGAVHNRMSPLTIEESSALTTVLGAVVGALAVYLGGSRNGHSHPPPDSASLLETPAEQTSTSASEPPSGPPTSH